MAPSSAETALSRWLADGVTSQTHPILRFALQNHLGPLGIRAEWLEVEPFGILECQSGGWWLRGARWEGNLLQPDHPAAPDFSCLIQHGGQFKVEVDGQGCLEIDLAPGTMPDSEAGAWFGKSGRGWEAIRHSVRAADSMEAFIYAAAGSLLASNPAATYYAEGKIDAFCREIDRCMGRTGE
jgi:hypothetical protein